MAKSPDEFLVNITFYNLRRNVADKIIDEAARIGGRTRISMETVEDHIYRSDDKFDTRPHG